MALILDTSVMYAWANLPGKTARHNALSPPEAPFQSLRIDFAHMPPVRNLKYLLTIVYRFSKWAEVHFVQQSGSLRSTENADIVVKFLSREIIQRYGISTVIDSDQRTPFTSKVTQKLCKCPTIDWKFHIPYHPQSSGVVERMNRTLKDRLITTAMMETGKNWIEILPAVLCEICMMPSATTKLSPYKIIIGRPFPTPWVKGNPGIFFHRRLGQDCCSLHPSTNWEIKQCTG